MMAQGIDFADVFGIAQMQGDPRKAALLLHALPASDRLWLLDRLPEAQRELLRQLLAELKELGIPVTRDVLDEVLSSAAAQPKPLPERPRAMPTIESELDRADPGALARILDGEPVGLIVRLLRLRAWPWQAQMLAGLREGKRREVEARLEETRESFAVPRSAGAFGRADRELLALLKDHLANRQVARNDLAEGPWWERWFRFGRPVPGARMN